jgi:hypothetical protein
LILLHLYSSSSEQARVAVGELQFLARRLEFQDDLKGLEADAYSMKHWEKGSRYIVKEFNASTSFLKSVLFQQKMRQ